MYGDYHVKSAYKYFRVQNGRWRANNDSGFWNNYNDKIYKVMVVMSGSSS